MLDFYSKYGKWQQIPINIGLYNANMERQQKANKKALEKMEKEVNALIKQGVTIDIAKAISNKLYRATTKKIAIINKCKQIEKNKGMAFSL